MVAPSTEFKTLQVNIQAAAPFSKHLFLKPHSSREDELPAGRTLFVAGIPLTISADDLVELFSAFGDVASLAVHPSKVTCILVVEEEAACKAALAAASDGTVLELTPAQPEGPTGLKSWVNAHKARFPGNQVLQRELDDWVTEHEAAAERKRKAAEAAADDGWTVVKRSKGRHKTTDEGGTAVAGVAAAAAAEAGARPRAQPPANFYRFQQRERRRDELFALREQFEADKRKIAELKAARRFKPM